VLFDLDGVLVNSFEAWWQLLNATARHLGYPPIEREQFQAVYGQPTEEDVRAFFPGQSVERVEGYYSAHFAEYSRYVQPMATAAEVVSALRQRGFRTAVITNTPSGLAREILSRAGITPDAVVGGDDVAKAKPAPDMVVLACHQLGIAPSEAVVVGDSRYDEQAAAAAGAPFVGLGLTAPQSVDSLAGLLDLLSLY